MMENVPKSRLPNIVLSLDIQVEELLSEVRLRNALV